MYLRVDTRRLRDAVTAAASAGTTLEDARSSIDAISGRLDADEQVSEAAGEHLGHFRERWNEEFRLIKEMIVRMNDGLEKTADAYDGFESEFAGQVRQISG